MKKVILIIFVILILTNDYSYSDSEELIINAESAILMDAQSKRILLEYNPHLKLPMASTTKIMTALVALNNGNLEDKIKIEKDIIGIEGSSIYLQDGEIITLEDLLYGLMLRSGNDSAMAIAKYIGSNLDKFIYMMNSMAKEIGANNTNFMNPHGLHDDSHYTTAYDLALITSKAMENEKFKEITSSKVWKANREKNNIFYNKNKTLWEYEGGDGVKTGYTTKSGRCLVTSATRDDTQLIAVVLNDADWFDDCYKLMDYGFKNYRAYVIFEKGQFFKNIHVNNGQKESVPVVAKNSFRYPLKEDELKKIKINLELPKTINAPIKKASTVGRITVYLNGRIIHEGEIITKENIDKVGILKRVIEKLK